MAESEDKYKVVSDLVWNEFETQFTNHVSLIKYASVRDPASAFCLLAK